MKLLQNAALALLQPLLILWLSACPVTSTALGAIDAVHVATHTTITASTLYGIVACVG